MVSSSLSPSPDPWNPFHQILECHPRPPPPPPAPCNTHILLCLTWSLPDFPRVTPQTSHRWSLAALLGYSQVLPEVVSSSLHSLPPPPPHSTVVSSNPRVSPLYPTERCFFPQLPPAVPGSHLPPIYSWVASARLSGPSPTCPLLLGE